MRWFPLFLDLRGRRVLVIGGGTLAERKIDLLWPAGPSVVVVSPTLTPRLAARRDAGEIVHAARDFDTTDVEGAALVVAATDAPVVNRAARVAAEARGIPVNVVDDAALSTAILPAIVDRSPLVIAISTEGTAPAFARHVRARLESLIDESYGELADLLSRWRGRIKARLTDLVVRRRFYDSLLAGRVGDLVRARRSADAEQTLETQLAANPAPARGLVQLVGAGPGDPGLLTLHALRALQGADVVLHDRLVSREVLALARREAVLIEVGKAAGGHSVAQQAIHELLREHALKGRRVVRLKGGDPFIFGRGGEELEFLKAHRIDFEVVPGITAAIACAAYSGIPLTHRDHAESVRFLTAHCRESVRRIDWSGLVNRRETLAIYMGIGTLEVLCEELTRHGRPASTPVAFIENGTRPEQRVITATLGSAPAVATRESVRSPALLVVGDVAAFAGTLHWFGARPTTAADGRSMAVDCAAAAVA